MSLLIRVLVFAGLGATVACGNPTTKDGRIVLSSQSGDHLIIPGGDYEDSIISKKKFAKEIAKRLNSISEVYDISMEGKLFAHESVVAFFTLGASLIINPVDDFIVSFTAQTTNGTIYKEINCIGNSIKHEFPVKKGDFLHQQENTVIGEFILSKCENDEVKLRHGLNMNISHILVNP